MPLPTMPAPAPAVLDEAQLLDYSDYPEVRKRFEAQVLGAVQAAFPVENDRYRLSLSDIQYAKPKTYSLAEQKHAILAGSSLTNKIVGTWELTDKQTGQSVAKTTPRTVLNVPYLTPQRGTFIRNGSEMIVTKQFRLQPNVYTRWTDDGMVESQFNAKPRSGTGFRIYMEPATSLFFMRHKGRKIPLYPVLRGLGYTPEQLEQHWGKEILAANRATERSPHAINWLSQFKPDAEELAEVPEAAAAQEEKEAAKATTDTEGLYRDVRPKLLESFNKVEFDPEAVQTTLGHPFERAVPEALVESTRKILRVSRNQDTTDDRDSLEFQTVHDAGDFLADKIKSDQHRLMANMLWKLTGRPDLDRIPSGILDKHVSHLFNESGLAEHLTEINPLDVFENNQRVVRMGEGGISSIDSVPKEARNVSPSYLGYVDPIRSPECHSSDTEVMTADGWKMWPEVCADDRLACMVDGRLQFNKPARLIAEPYAGPMYGGASEYLNYLVTPNHRMWTRPADHGLQFRFELPSRVSARTRNFLTGGHLPATISDAPTHFQLPAVIAVGAGTEQYSDPPVGAALKTYPPIPMEDWAEFMGWYLAEGCCLYQEEASVYRVIISQSKATNTAEYEHIRSLLSRLPFAFSEISGEKGFVIANKQIAQYCSRYGKSGDKYVPAYVLAGTENVRRRFLTAALSGDGRKDTKGRRACYLSVSRRLCEDIHRIVFSLGMASRLYFEKDDRPQSNFGGTWCCYIHERTERQLSNKQPGTHKNQYFTADYDGVVYCAEVPGGLLYTRRNDSVGFWSGNSLKIGVDMKFARGIRKGPGNLLYRQFLTPDGKKEWVSTKQAAHSIVAFPGAMDNKDEFVTAMVRSRGIEHVPRKDVQYVLPSGDDMFSHGANLVPFKSGDKGMRLLMGSKYASQALSLVNRQPPYVQTSAGPDDSASAEHRMGPYLGAMYAPQGGIVRELDAEHLVLEGPDGKRSSMDLYNTHPFNRKSYVRNIPHVRVGQRVGPGELLASSNYTDDKGTSALGTNLRVGYLNYDGKNFEDAIVVSASAAKNKLVSEHLYMHDLDKEKDLTVGKQKYTVLYPSVYKPEQLAKIGDDGVIKAGSVVQHGDPLYLAVREREPSPQTLGRRLRSDETVTWDHAGQGVVSDVVQTRNGYAVAIRSNEPLMVADKLSSRHGGKGVVSEIVPDDQMPHDASGRPLEILVSPLSVVSRTNSAQMIEAQLGKVAAKTGKPYVLPGFSTEHLAEMAQKELAANGLTDTEDLTDPRTGKTIPGIFTGNSYFYKLQHTAESKGKSRSVAHYTEEEQPAQGGKLGGKHIGCFPAHQKVLTATGERLIGNLVEKRHSAQVWSFDRVSGTWGYRPITNWFTHRARVSDMLRIEVDGAASVCGGRSIKHTSCLYPTVNHAVYLFDGSTVLAGDLRAGDELCTWGPVPTTDQRGLILGSLLGDAYFSEGGFQMMHSAKQGAYLRFKQRVLAGLLATVNACSDTAAPDGVRHERALLTLNNHPLHNEFGALCLQDGKKYVTRAWLDQVNDLGICIWLLDDGHIINHAKKAGQVSLQGSIATNSFSKAEAELLAIWLGERMQQDTPTIGWYVNAPNKNLISQSTEAQPRLNLSAAMCRALVELLARTVPADVLPGSKKFLAGLMRDRQAEVPPRSLDYCCRLGAVPAVIRAISPYVHPKRGVDEICVYDFTVDGVHNYTAGNVLVSNSMELDALLGHGANAVLKDLKMVKGQRNDDFWRKLKLGETPGMPGTPLVYDKFRAMIKAAGVNLHETPTGDSIFAMTNKQAEDLTGDREIQRPVTYGATTGRPIPGGLFDPAMTGSQADGNRWSYIKLPEKMPNPVMEAPIRSILGMTQKTLDGYISGETEYGGKRGGAALEALLRSIDLPTEKQRAMDEIKGKAVSKRDAAIKRYGYIDAMMQQGLHPTDFLMDRVPVLPPRFRPITVNPKLTVVADANYLYKALLEQLDDFKEAAQLPQEQQNEARRNIYHTYKAVVGTADPLQPELQQKGVGGILQQMFGKGSPKACYDDETEVLTENGWMMWPEYVGQCELATVHPLTQRFEYHMPTALVHAEYDGMMASFQGRYGHINMLVTPNHRMWVKQRDHRVKGRQDMERGWGFAYAEDVVKDGQRQFFRHTATGFDGDRELPAFVTGNKELFAEFVGWWVAEGWLHNDGCTAYVCQSPRAIAHCASIDAAVSSTAEALGCRFSKAEYAKQPLDGKTREPAVYWGIHSKELVAWLRANCGDSAHTKFLSRDIRGWSDVYLRRLLTGYLGGDGGKRQKQHKGADSKTHRITHEFADYDALGSASRQLLEDLQDVGCKIGVPVTIYDRQGPNGVETGGIPACGYSPLEGKEYRYLEAYAGEVHCATVPNGLLIVRRLGGMPVVSGNSFVQRRLIGTNIDVSGLGVVVPNPDLSMDQVGMPENLAWNLYEPFVIRHMVRQGTPATVAAKAVVEHSAPAYAALQEVIKERPVLLNRAPTLHKYSIMAFHPVLIKGNAIQASPLITKTYSMDFDGDTASFTVPVSKTSVEEALQKMLPSKNLLAARDDKPLYPITNEHLQGLYFASKEPRTDKPVRQFASQADADAAFKAGKIKLDDPIEIVGSK